MDLGIQRQIRETLPASLMARCWTLELLHEPPALAEQLVSRFARHDADLLARQQAIASTTRGSSSSRRGNRGMSWRRSWKGLRRLCPQAVQRRAAGASVPVMGIAPAPA